MVLLHFKEAALNMSSMLKHLISVSLFAFPAAVAAQSAPASQAPVVKPVVFKPGVGATTPQQGTVPLATPVPPNLTDPSGGSVPAAIQRWRMLTSSGNYDFSEYASFLLAYPDWPENETLRRNAEQAINPLTFSPSQAVAYFDRLPPLTNTGHAKYAIALSAIGDKTRSEEWARKAWRLGPVTDDDEARLLQIAGTKYTPGDYDARVEALLWAGGTRSATKYVNMTSAARRPVLEAWLATRTNAPDANAKIAAVGNVGHAGLIGGRANALRDASGAWSARDFLANRPKLQAPPTSISSWYKLLLTHATSAANDGQYDTAFRIASRVEDALPAGMIVANEELPIRDQYTNLTWMAARLAMDKLNKPAEAARMFRLYGEAAQSPQTRSKGFYWAGKASTRARDNIAATGHFESAAQYFDYFYGQLALEALGRPLPAVPQALPLPNVATGSGAPSSYIAASIAPRYGTWKEQSAFVRAISKSAKTPDDYQKAFALANKLNRPDLAVMAGRNARSSGYADFVRLGFPTVNIPADHKFNWTFIHAISRQESQFDKAIVSHAGAKGLMQLMPGTAREVAGKLSMSYKPDALTSDTDYNIALGSSYFQRMLDNYNGSYPMAVAAYNAGPGNVNKWLRANGDPRAGAISMVDWIEAIPIFETRNYVQRVLENAVMYEHLNPQSARNKSKLPLSYYLGKTTPG